MKIIKELSSYIIIVVSVILIRMFIITPAIVNGSSMEPTLMNHEIVLINKFNKKINRFDIIVLKYNKEQLVKRVIGMPGEHIQYKDGKLYINEVEVSEKFVGNETHDFDIRILDLDVIPKNYYFVVGDNRNNSKDSRSIGIIHIDDIIGKTNFRLFPFSKFGKIN